MTLEQIYYVSQIAAGIVLIASILFLAAQVRQNSRMIERAMTEEHNLAWRWTYQQVAQSREFAAFHKQIGDNYDKLDEIDKYRAEWLGQMNLRGMLHSMQARADGLIADPEWRFLKARMKRFGRRKNMELAWEREKDSYSQQVQALWDECRNG